MNKHGHIPKFFECIVAGPLSYVFYFVLLYWVVRQVSQRQIRNPMTIIFQAICICFYGIMLLLSLEVFRMYKAYDFQITKEALLEMFPTQITIFYSSLWKQIFTLAGIALVFSSWLIPDRKKEKI